MSTIAHTPKPPYYAVILTSELTAGEHGYGIMADKMVELAAAQPGFLGIESSDRNQEGLGITVSYWDSLESIKNWKENSMHQVAQDKGKSVWYKRFGLRVCKVERDNFFEM
ncbi:antibiotic biosynthesis monooxygenase [Paenibacillus sp. N1-5-1-14]|uniref:antibiotic biosynthesis monooxygenase family protein n=1 Tax=Paenibacillus radicibacter TaxID=2972488 RepID=UPI0021599569|nr:antibiotic biosynthesis monooxygenase [Paenibacillus radicibacter]MCR8641660.1 antibiotic biosynthesis monooxygenase [Paenibacillus radicibacter]